MANDLKITTPSDCEIVMTREFDAPRRLVWEAMTRPEFIRRWIYAPRGLSMTVCEGGPLVGDPFRWVWHDDSGNQALEITGVTLEIVPLEKAVHTEKMFIGNGVPVGELLATIELSEHSEKTSLRMTLLFPSKEARDSALSAGMEQGVASGYARLDELLLEFERLAPSH